MRLTFQAAGRFGPDGRFTPGAKRLVTVEVRDGEAVADRFTLNSAVPRSRAQATRHGMTDPEVITACDKTLETGTAVSWEATVEAVVTGQITLTIRERDATDGEQRVGPTQPTLRAAIESVRAPLLVTWRDREEACCLDIDYHNTPPIRSHLEATIEARLTPRPSFWHFSKGGGVHAFYFRSGDFTAEELAAAAAIRYRTIDPAAGIDLVTMVFGGEDLRDGLGGAFGAESCLPGAATEPDASAVDDWLDTHRMAIGQRYDHSFCPIDPGGDAKNQPVVVSEHGIHCFRCAARGLSIGSRKPGFASFTALTGATDGDVSRLIANKVHWGHARWVLTEKYELPESLARLGYRAALRGAGLADDELAAAFCTETADMARSGDSWVNLMSGAYHYPTAGGTVVPLIGALPACMERDDKGRLRGVGSRVAYYSQGHDLSERGYGNLNVVRGFRLARQFLPVPTEVQVGMLPKELRGSPRAPRYIRRSERGSVEAAERVFERTFPGLSWTAVRSQVCAAAVAQETRLGLHPMTFISGPSGAAKTTTVKIAAGILGSSAPEVSYHRDEEKLRRGIAEAGKRGAFALCNEFLKDHARHSRGRFDPRAAMETILTLTPEVQIHVMYVGSRPLGRLPAIVFTEPKCPYMLRDYRQISRRVRLVNLFGAKEAWKDSLAALNLTPDTIHMYRLRDAELATAADVILSDLIDAYFASPLTWDSIADSLGCPTIEGSPEFDNPRPAMLEFFKQVCEAPELTDRLAKKYPGYKRICRTDGDDNELVDLWNQFCAGPNAEWFQSSILGEADWGGIIGSDQGVVFEVKNDGASSVYVRFHVGPIAKPTYVNETIPRKVL